MKKSTKRLLTALVAGMMIAPLYAQSTKPAMTQSHGAATPAVALDREALQAFVKDVRPEAIKVAKAVNNKADWSSADRREAVGADIQDELKDLLTKIDDMAQRGKTAEVDAVGGTQFTTWAAVFGKDDVIKQLNDMAGKSGPEGIWARTAIAAGQYYRANGDATGQAKALDSLEAVYSDSKTGEAKSPAEQAAKMSVARAEMEIYQEKPSKEITDRIDNYLTNTLQLKVIAQIKEQQAAVAKQEALVGQPLVLEGRLKDGSHFSTADLKGKVILVDFWASWCGPCKAELPRVKKEYAQMHDKGLEVIGVSFDQTDDALTKFLGDNPDMPWPQFYDPEHPYWQNQFGKKYGIQGIPTMFLIDKNGICRSVKAREDFETEIPKLLDEKGAL